MLISKKKNLKHSLIGTGGPKSDSKFKDMIFQEFLEVSKNVDIPIRKYGSASLDLASVACGRFDGFWQRELSIWDIAAGIIIVKEAGGFVDLIEKKISSPLELYPFKRFGHFNPSGYRFIAEQIEKKIK